MAEQEVDQAKEEALYQFDKLPENIRQIGEQPEKKRIYIEDYVNTYLHQYVKEHQEQGIVVFLGKMGEGEAEGIQFIYGAVDVELNIAEGEGAFTKNVWDKIYDLAHQYFPGAQVMGWSCGVSMLGSKLEKGIGQIQQKQFAQEGKLLFLRDFSEQEDKVFRWQRGRLCEISGHTIYYARNPLMQEYMLRGEPKKSMEADYEDKVMSSVRQVIRKKSEGVDVHRAAAYTTGFILVIFTLLGAALLRQSNRKIDSLERTIETLSGAAAVATAPAEGTSLPKQSGASKDKKDKSDKKETRKPEGEKKPVESAGNEQKTPADGEQKTEQKTGEKQEPAALPTIPAPSPGATADILGGTAGDSIKKTLDEKLNENKKTGSEDTKNKGNENKGNENKDTEDKEAKKNTTPAVSRVQESYVVQAGDTLSQIVWRQYHDLSCMEMVRVANDIEDTDKIREGQRIILPAYPK